MMKKFILILTVIFVANTNGLFAQNITVKADTIKKGLSEDQRASFKQKAAAGHVTNYNAADHMGEPRQDHVDKGWIGFKGGTSEIKIWGWVQGAVFADSDQNYFNDVQEFSSGVVAVPNDSQGTFGFDAKSSRIFIQSRHYLKSGNAISTTFVMDAGGADLTGWATPRIRQFFVTINNLTFGAANGTFANANTWPAYMDRGAPGSYPLARKGVIRYGIPLNKEHKARSVLTFGIEQPTAELANATMRYTMPEFVARYDYSPDWGNLMFAVIARDLNAESMDDTLPGEDQTMVWGLQFSGVWTFGKAKDHLRWIALYGPAVSGYMWDSGFEPGNTGFYDPNTGTIETMNGLGLTLAYEHNWTKKLQSTFMYAYANIDNIEGQPDSAFRTTNTGTVTLRYNPFDSFYIAGEYFYGKRENYNGQSASDNRMNIIFRYIFNR